MKVTKQQIIKGVIEFAKKDILDTIMDKPLQIILATGITALETNPSLADSIFENPMVSTILKEQNGQYDIDDIFAIIETTLNEYGDFPIIIPKIKFITPCDKELRFSANDIKRLKTYIGGNSNGNAGIQG